MANQNVQLPAFIRAHLDRIAKAEHFVSYEISTDAGSKSGDGFMGEMVAIRMTGPRLVDGVIVAHAELPLICKMLPKSLLRREHYQCKVIFKREVHMYSEILPMLRKFQEDNGLTEQTGFMAYPHCYAASVDVATDDYVIIMHDLRSYGFELWEKKRPMPYEHARLLFEQLGRLHGVSAAMRSQRPELFEKFRDLGDYMTTGLERMRPMVQSAYNQAIRYLPDEDHKEVMRTFRDNCAAWMEQTTNGAEAEPYTVLGHGDCWMNNFMYRGQEKICILDWQFGRYVSPALDLSYFLFTSTDKALRDNHYEQLIAVYHENFLSVGKACGADERKLMSFEQLQQQLRTFGKYGIVMAPMLLQVVVGDSNSVIDMDAMAEEWNRPDYDSSKEVEITIFDDTSLAKYRQRLGDAISDAKRWGWL